MPKDNHSKELQLMNKKNLWYVCKYCNRAYKEGKFLVLHKKQEHYEDFTNEKRLKKEQKKLELLESQSQKVNENGSTHNGERLDSLSLEGSCKESLLEEGKDENHQEAQYSSNGPLVEDVPPIPTPEPVNGKPDENQKGVSCRKSPSEGMDPNEHNGLIHLKDKCNGWVNATDPNNTSGRNEDVAPIIALTDDTSIPLEMESDEAVADPLQPVDEQIKSDTACNSVSDNKKRRRRRLHPIIQKRRKKRTKLIKPTEKKVSTQQQQISESNCMDIQTGNVDLQIRKRIKRKRKKNLVGSVNVASRDVSQSGQSVLQEGIISSENGSTENRDLSHNVEKSSSKVVQTETLNSHSLSESANEASSSTKPESNQNGKDGSKSDNFTTPHNQSRYSIRKSTKNNVRYIEDQKCKKCQKLFAADEMEAHDKECIQLQCKHCRFRCADSVTLENHESKKHTLVSKEKCKLFGIFKSQLMRSKKGVPSLEERQEKKRELPVTVKKKPKCSAASDDTTVRTKSIALKSTANCKEIRFNNVKLFTCDSKTQEMQEIQVNSQPEGSLIKGYACNMCNETFTSVNTGRIHGKIHAKECPYTCNYKNCIARFKSRLHLREHKRVEHGPSNSVAIKSVSPEHLSYKLFKRSYKCEPCGRTFVKEAWFRNHVRLHKKVSSTDSENCHLCPLKFRRNLDLQKHLLTHDDTDFMCQFCGKKYFTELDLKKHEQIHQN